jgi:5'-deoxynucleotidase YfbR-like HD superfamily hydrolase
MSSDLIRKLRSNHTTLGQHPLAKGGFLGVGMAISGIMFNLEFPDPNDVHLCDIIFGESRIPRYNGATLTSEIWSVGNHILVCDAVYLFLCRKYGVPVDHEFRMALFFHDAAEIYTGDMVTPLKKIMRAANQYELFEKISDQIDEAIRTKFRLSDQIDHKDIKFIDNLAYEVERVWHRPVYDSSKPLSFVEEAAAVTKFLRDPGSLSQCWENLRNLALDINNDIINKYAVEIQNPYKTGILFETNKAEKHVQNYEFGYTF